VLVVAYAVRGTTGFSAAGMPLLGLVIPIKILVPAWTLLGIASSATILGRDLKYVSGMAILRMLPTCLIGAAIGLYFFKTLDARTLAQGLGLLVICYGCYSLWITASMREKQPAAGRIVAPLAGIVGGAVGTTFGTMASLFFAIYFDAVRMAKEHLRATMSAMLLTLSLVRGFGYFAVGEVGRDVWVLAASAFPMMILGILIGDRFHARINERAFRYLVSAVLIVSGIALVLK
jgi:uncharacterized membrane protein YfcA